MAQAIGFSYRPIPGETCANPAMNLQANSFCGNTILNMYFVYVLENAQRSLDNIVTNQNKNLYIGYTANIERRIEEHNTGKDAQYTRMKTWRLIYYEAYLNKQDALGREKFPKGGSGRKYFRKQLTHYFNNS